MQLLEDSNPRPRVKAAATVCHAARDRGASVRGFRPLRVVGVESSRLRVRVDDAFVTCGFERRWCGVFVSVVSSWLGRLDA